MDFITKIQGQKFIITAVLGIIVYIARFTFGEITIGDTVLPAIGVGDLSNFIWVSVLAIFAKLKLNRAMPDKPVV